MTTLIQECQDTATGGVLDSPTCTYGPPVCAGSGDLGTPECGRPPDWWCYTHPDTAECTLFEPLTTPPTVQCYEDEPCWDCTLMGNGICGPVTELQPPSAGTPDLPILPVTGPEYLFVLLFIAASAIIAGTIGVLLDRKNES